MDGILIETEPIWDKVRRRLAAEDGLSWPESSTPIMMGLSTQEWAEHMTDVVGFSGTWQEMAQRVIDGMAGEYASGGLPVLPGAVEAVRRMAGLVPTAIASSSPRRLIDLVVSRLDLGDALTVTVSTEEVPRGKPFPDGYLRACELLDTDPARSVAVEDSTNRVRSAFARGNEGRLRTSGLPPARRGHARPLRGRARLSGRPHRGTAALLRVVDRSLTCGRLCTR